MNRKYLIVLLYCFVLAIPSQAVAQDHILKGVIERLEDGAPVPFATVFCKNQRKGTASNLSGYFHLSGLSEGPCHLRVTSLGYRALDTVIQVKKSMEIRLCLKKRGLRLDEIIVIAKKSTALPTSSIINRDALSHLQPSSFADILELMPGGISQQNSMTHMNLISLREPVAAAEISKNNHNTSLGTAFVIDGAPISNDAELQNVNGTFSSDRHINDRNTTGKGIDMRTLSTDDIEKVEIVRGIPSVQYGDLTSGLVKIERSYRPKPFNLRVKTNVSTKLIALGKGLSLGRRSLNANFGYVEYKSNPTNPIENYGRATASLRFANHADAKAPHSFLLHSSLDYTGSFDRSQKDLDNDSENDYFKNDYTKLRFTSGFSWRFSEIFLDKITGTFSASYEHKKKTIRGTVSGQLSPILSESEAGEYYGEFLPASYVADLTVDGKPVFLYGQLRAKLHFDTGRLRHNIFLGGEWRYNKNYGEGEIYDVQRPLYPGNSRPRSSKDIPASQLGAFFLENNTTLPIGRHELALQVGVRNSAMLNLGERYAINNRLYADPRFNLAWHFPKIRYFWGRMKWTLTGGMGWHTKFPTLSHLFPTKKYYDVVQLNYYSQNPALRQMHYKVDVVDRTNFQLRPNRNKKWELGFRVKSGSVEINVTGYRELMKEGFKGLSRYSTITYKKYDITSGPSSDELVAPPTVDMFDYKTCRDFFPYSKTFNGGREEKYGIEFQIDFGRIKAIQSRVSINGAWMTNSYELSTETYRSSSIVIGDKSYPYIGYYEWASGQEYEQFNTNFRFDTQISQLGLIFSTTLQAVWYTNKRHIPNDGMPEYYIDKDGNKYPYTQAHTTDPILMHLYDKPSPNEFDDDYTPIAIDLNLKVTKLIGSAMRLAFYVNRIAYYYPDYTDNGYTVRRKGKPYFGMELQANL